MMALSTASPAGGFNLTGIGWNVERNTESKAGNGGTFPNRISVQAPFVYMERNITHEASASALPCQYGSISLYRVRPFVRVLPNAPVKSFFLYPTCTIE